jgi:glycosyltransferase involved in cell wall biosynthesis
LNKPCISVLLPTRGRGETLKRSINSLIDLADCPGEIEIKLGFDDDDSESVDYCVKNILPALDQRQVRYDVYSYPPMGYGRLNEYVNSLAKTARGDWFVFWNDDAVMQDQGWDTEIKQHTGRFVIQAFDTHNLHPYSIFPIVPRKWFEVLGHLSLHPLNDAYISQIAWLLNIMVRIPVRVLHDRADLTGNNNDSTYQQRRYFEGNINDPLDFNHVGQRKQRMDATAKLASYMRSNSIDTSHWDLILAGKQDPWAKMMAADINNQMTRFS